jgi:hypothetical protein
VSELYEGHSLSVWICIREVFQALRTELHQTQRLTSIGASFAIARSESFPARPRPAVASGVRPARAAP